MVLRQTLAGLLVLSLVLAGCVSPTGTATETPTATETESPTELLIYGPCTFERHAVSADRAMAADADARREFEALPADQRRIFLGEGDGDGWNYSVRYVRYEGEWYEALVACP
ncbi:hypothetical protein [Haloarcula marina]|uniref:hypothetical protein n=1 Tax=Haloarcula marina TaxID=2961574 RepID=UPI0020B6B52A|nr:hypothetical protein [Halomicroarcula marina]